VSYIDVFRNEKGLIEKLGEDKAHIAWVMARYLEEADTEGLAATAITDGPDDKKIDFIYLDHDTKRLVLAQGYYASKPKESAPANKASDLNTAAAWFFSGDLDAVPDTIRDVVKECRAALDTDEIESIELLYVHNLPESINVVRELQTAEDFVKKALGSTSISVRAIELGVTRIQHLYDAQDSHIEVKDDIEFPSDVAFEENGPKWKAYVGSVPGNWLHTIYTKYGDTLFSANYRGFLGSGRRRRVNTGIKESAENRPADFWAFNNGITVLTITMKSKEKSKARILGGMSVINGAQTTGSIGSVDLAKKSITDLRVLCRVIECSDPETIADIVRFNNTQNAITSWDQYSNDPDQKRLALEFSEYGFVYNIKRGFVGTGDDLGIDEVIQPLLAFHGRPQDAVRGKNQIFDRKPLYQNAFDGKKARHVLFVFSLSRAIDECRLALKKKSNTGGLIAVEAEQLALMRNLRFKAFFIALMAGTIETAIGKKCDAQTVGFTPEAAKKHSLLELVARWAPVVDTLLALITAGDDVKEFAGSLSDEAYLQSLAKKMNAMLHATGAAKKHEAFAELIAGA
jgi:hypothetical protein